MNHNKKLRFAGVLTALCGTLASAPAQQGGTANTGDINTAQNLLGTPQVSYTDLVGHEIEDGIHWVAGDRYKARFHNGTMEFTPALGNRAPYNMTWSYRFQRMEQGGGTLAVATDHAQPEWDSAKRVIRIPRGPGIDEVHQVRPEGLEITYELAARPQGSGDLVVTATVVSELQARAGEYGAEGIDFRMPEVGGIHLTGVFGIDANGARTHGTLGWDGREMTFTLPGAFLDEATYPVVLDPTLGTAAEIDAPNGGNNDTKPDIAFDLTNNIYAICWQRVFSLGDAQIRAARLDGTTYAAISPLFTAVSPFASGTFHEKPAIANNNFSDQFLVVWAQSAGLLSPRDIYGRTYRPDGTLSTNTVAIATGTADQFEPDVGGDARGTDDDCIVVWTDASQGIRSMQVAVPAALDPINQGEQAVTTTPSDRQPAVSKTMLTNRTLAVWRSSAGSIQGRFLNNNGTAVGVEANISTSTLNDSNPDVDGDGSVWMVVWEQLESNLGVLTDVYCRRVNIAGSTNLSFPEAETGLGVVGTTAGEEERDPSVSIHNIRFVVCYEDERTINSGPSDIAVAFVGRDACRECGTRSLIRGSTSAKSVLPSVCSRRSGGDPDSDRGAIIWSSADLTPPFDGDAYVQGVQSAGNGNPLINTGGGCGAAGAASVGNGPGGVLGNLETTVELNGASITSPFAFLWGAVAGPAPHRLRTLPEPRPRPDLDQHRDPCEPRRSLRPGADALQLQPQRPRGGVPVHRVRDRHQHLPPHSGPRRDGHHAHHPQPVS